MKKQLKLDLKQILNNVSYEQFNSEHFKLKTNQILKKYNCQFRYLRSDSKKNGHMKYTYNKVTKQTTYELAINKKDNIGGKVYTIIHELTHLINNHMKCSILTKKQAEIVADTCARYFVFKYQLYDLYKTSDVANKWDVDKYSDYYIDNMQLSSAKKEIIIAQITDTISKLETSFK